MTDEAMDGTPKDDNPLDDVVKSFPPDTQLQISPATGIAAMGLNLSLKYHDINTVQDGTLYQQYKLEGKNLRGLTLDSVLETAKIFERHILEAPNRLTNAIMETITESIEAELDAKAGPLICELTIDGKTYTHEGWTITGKAVYELAGNPRIVMLKSDDPDVVVGNNDEYVIDLDVDFAREFYTQA